MAGIGFLGAGVIIKHDGSVHGLTTAAGLWCVAAIGLASGLGLYLIACIAALLVLAALWFLGSLERWLPKVHYRTIILRRPWHAGVVRETIEMVEKKVARQVRGSSFHRPGDMTMVIIRLQIAFMHRDQYFNFEEDLEKRGDCQVVSVSRES
jgi:putative Mg2+ transporter-C (MgtC) family protein